MLQHSLYRAGNGICAATGQGIAGVGGELSHFSGGYAQSSGTGFERTQHDAVAGQNQPAQKMSLCINRLHRDGGTDHDHHHGARRMVSSLLFHARECANHRHPTVSA